MNKILRIFVDYIIHVLTAIIVMVGGMYIMEYIEKVVLEHINKRNQKKSSKGKEQK